MIKRPITCKLIETIFITPVLSTDLNAVNLLSLKKTITSATVEIRNFFYCVYADDKKKKHKKENVRSSLKLNK